MWQKITRALLGLAQIFHEKTAFWTIFAIFGPHGQLHPAKKAKKF